MPDDSHPVSRALVAAPAGFTGRPSNFLEMEKLASWFASSESVPPAYRNKPADCFVAIQMGLEVGLAPMQAIQNIAMINGRPSIFGDAMIGLCWQSPLCEDIMERLEGSGDNRVAICVAKRRGASTPIERRFSVADAKRAKLWQENPTVTRHSKGGGTYETDAGPWYSYPERMLQMRARSWSLRDAFPDVLRGLASTEEMQDTFSGTTIDGTATAVMSDAPAVQTPAQPATEAAENGAADDSPAKWKAGLEVALKGVATQDDLNALINRETFTAWRAKATPPQETDIARMIATRRAELMAAAVAKPAEPAAPEKPAEPAPDLGSGPDMETKPGEVPAPEPSDACKALLAQVAKCTAKPALDSLMTATEFSRPFSRLPTAEGDLVDAAIKQRYIDVEGK